MTEHNPHIVDVNSLNDAIEAIKDIGSDPASFKIMAPKMITCIMKLENVILQDAIIIKQDMLSIGGEVAVPKNAFEIHDATGDILIIGTLTQLCNLVNKLKRHYSRIKKIAEDLEVILKDLE